MQMLYHCNLGPPFLEAGSRVLAPVPRDGAAHARGPPRASTPTTPTSARPPASPSRSTPTTCTADAKGQTLALLANAAADRAVALRFNNSELPCFTVWKNTAARGGRLRHRPGAGD